MIKDNIKKPVLPNRYETIETVVATLSDLINIINNNECRSDTEYNIEQLEHLVQLSLVGTNIM